VGRSRYVIEVPGIIRVPTGIDRNPNVYLTYAQEFIGYLTEYVQKHPFGFYNFFQMWKEQLPIESSGLVTESPQRETDKDRW
jgi:hypothetical protein